MDTIKTKKIDTNEDVNKGNASRTLGNLKADDIIEQHFSPRTVYINKKMQNTMKKNVSTIHSHNPNFIRKKQKKTYVNTRDETPQSIPIQSIPIQSIPIQSIPIQSIPNQSIPIQSIPNQSIPNQSIPNQSIPNQSIPIKSIPNKIKSYKTHNNKHISNGNQHNRLHSTSKTQKISFKIKDNAIKTVFYPELQGLNLNELKEELLHEEANEDLCNIAAPKARDIFTIEEMPDIDIDNL